MEEIQKKTCTRCKEEKPVTEFNKNNSIKDKLHVYCRVCTQIISRKYYKIRQDKNYKPRTLLTPEQKQERLRVSRKKKYENDKEAFHKRSRIWKEKNKEKVKEYNKEYFREYYIKNKEKLKKKDKANYNKNKEEILKKQKVRYKKMKEFYYDYQKNYYAKNREKYLEYYAKRKAKLLGESSTKDAQNK